MQSDPANILTEPLHQSIPSPFGFALTIFLLKCIIIITRVLFIQWPFQIELLSKTIPSFCSPMNKKRSEFLKRERPFTDGWNYAFIEAFCSNSVSLTIQTHVVWKSVRYFLSPQRHLDDYQAFVSLITSVTMIATF